MRLGLFPRSLVDREVPLAPRSLVGREVPPRNPCYQRREREPIGQDTSQWPPPAARGVLLIGSLPASGDPCCLDPRQTTWRPGLSTPKPTPVPHWLLWGPPPSNDEGGAESRSARPLRRDLGLRGLQVPKLSARPANAASLRRTPFSPGTWLGAQSRPALRALCSSTREPDPEGPSEFEAATWRGNPLRAAQRGVPTAVCEVRAFAYFSP